MQRAAKINLIVAIVATAIPQVLNAWGETYAYEYIGTKLLSLRFLCGATELVIIAISIVMLIFRLLRKDIESAIIYFATIIIVLYPIIPVIFLVSTICIVHLMSKHLRKDTKPAVISLASTLVITAPFLFHANYEQIQMRTGAFIFSQWPNLCQQNKHNEDDTYVCYHYEWDDIGVLSPSNACGDYWLVIDKTDKMSGTPDTWPLYFKYIFDGTPRFVTIKGLEVEPMGRHVYLVSQRIE